MQEKAEIRASQLPVLDAGTEARMRILGIEPQEILTGDIGSIMEKAPSTQETEYGNARAEVIAALYAADRETEVLSWMMSQVFRRS